MSNDQRKQALRIVSVELRRMPDEDIARVLKLCKAELKSRTAYADVTSDLDEAEAAPPAAPVEAKPNGKTAPTMHAPTTEETAKQTKSRAVAQ